MSVYYNENNPKKAEGLRELIKEGVIAPGDVDTRSIKEVSAEDVKGYTQCHWFAGIGVWSYALRLAGWDDDRPVWTGSSPCQGFSTAGKGKGFDDPRHLWPDWFRIIQECRPPIIFGEQVEAAIKKQWLDLVQDDMEGKDYAFGKIVLPACSIGAPHLRQRIWFMAHTCSESFPQKRKQSNEERQSMFSSRIDLGNCSLPNTSSLRFNERRETQIIEVQRERSIGEGEHTRSEFDGELSRGSEGLCGINSNSLPDSSSEGSQRFGLQQFRSARERTLREGRLERGFWGDVEWLPFKDGKHRITKSSIVQVADDSAPGFRQMPDSSGTEFEKKMIYPLVNKSQDSSHLPLDEIDLDNTPEARTLRLHAYGDAIVAELAAEVIGVVLEWLDMLPSDHTHRLL